ncbi:MAG: hypothetical protein SNJ76_08475 [Fimbriimonadaceae bacterium]
MDVLRWERPFERISVEVFREPAAGTGTEIDQMGDRVLPKQFDDFVKLASGASDREAGRLCDGF